MTSIVNTNMNSLVAQNNLSTNQASLATAMQRLSSGLRINSAKDDAAGLAISQRMTAQINGSNQAARNANDGISLAQTAEGALAQIGTNLQRMRELAVQSANGTNSASDRAALNNEVQALSQEINRVAQSASFNGVNLLDGSFTAQKFQVGANGTVNDAITVNSISSAQTSVLGGVGTTYAATTSGTATTTGLSAGDLTLNGKQVGASVLGAGPGQSTASAYSIANAINSTVGTGVSALANVNTKVGVVATSIAAVAANTFSINGIAVGAVASGGNAAGQGANLAAAINAVATQTGVAAVADALTGAVTLTAADGRDINIQLVATAATDAAATTNKANFLAQTGLTVSQAAAGTAGTALVNSTTFTPVGTATGGTIAAGALTANGVSVGAVTLAAETNVAAVATTAGTAGSTLTFNAVAAGTVLNLTVSGSATGSVSFTTSGNATTDAQAFAAQVNALNAATVTGAANVLTLAATMTLGVVASGGAVATAAAATANKAAIDASITAGAGTGAAMISGKQTSGGAAYNGQVIAAALNAALASATGGAGVNGSVAANAATGVITTTKGTGNMNIGMGGTAASAAAAVTNQTALATQTGLSAAQLGTQAYAAGGTENHGTITLSSTNASGIVWAGAAATSAGLAATGTATASVASTVSSIASMDVLTAADATAALATIDGALASVNASRASLGAIQNRFTSVVSSLQTTAQNLTASVSRIQDADFAAETAALSRSQILQQAGTAMVAQANQGPQGVLALLR